MTRWIWGGLSLVVALVIVAGGWSLLTARVSLDEGRTALERPGDFGAVPDFSLTDSHGRTVTLADLKGEFWIADFIFTRCNGLCPLLTSRMAALSRQIEGVRFVSISVDPEHDTPEVLARFAAANAGAAGDRWIFVTGPPADIERLVMQGFRLSMAAQEPGAAGGDPITHSDRFALVGPEGTIRGYYRGTEDDSMDRLREDLARLRATEEQKRPV